MLEPTYFYFNIKYQNGKNMHYFCFDYTYNYNLQLPYVVTKLSTCAPKVKLFSWCSEP